MTVYEYAGRPIPQRPRPGKATAAGTLLVSLGAIGLLSWLGTLLLAWTVASIISTPGSGGDGLQLQHYTFLLIVLPFCFFATELALGVFVLRGPTRARVPAIVVGAIATLASACSVLGLLGSQNAPLMIISFAYIGVNYWLVYLLMSDEVATWCRQG